MRTTFIYTISDEFGVIRYIGKSNNPKNRLYHHINERSNMHKYNWLRSIIKRGNFPIVEILEEVPEDNWEIHEMYWISQFKAWGFKLINLTDGGEGGIGYKHTFESKRKMSNKKLGGKLSVKHREKISNSVKLRSKEDPNYNKCHDKEHIISKEDLYQKYIVENLSLNKCADYFKTSKHTIFRNITECGFKKDKSAWEDQLATNPRKPVIQYDINHNKLGEFDSAYDANLSTGANVSSISNCCLGRQKSAGGFIWSYK